MNMARIEIKLLKKRLSLTGSTTSAYAGRIPCDSCYCWGLAQSSNRFRKPTATALRGSPENEIWWHQRWPPLYRNNQGQHALWNQPPTDKAEHKGLLQPEELK